MKFSLYLFFLLFPIQLLGQNFALREVQVQDESNAYLISSAPFIDKDGFVWYAANRDGDFYRFDGRYKLRYSYFKDEQVHPNSFYISRLAWLQQPNGNIWAVEPDKAYVIVPEEHQVQRISYATAGLGKGTAAGVDAQQQLWISNGSDYLIKIGADKKPVKVSHPLLAGAGRAIEIFKTMADGRLFARAGDHLFVIAKNKIEFLGNSQTIDKLLTSDFHLIENGRIFRKNSSGFYRHNHTTYRYVYLKALNLQAFNSTYANNHANSPYYWYSDAVWANSRWIAVNGNRLFINQVNSQGNEMVTTDTLNFKGPIAINSHNGSIWISTDSELHQLMLIQQQFTRMLQSASKKISTRSIVSDLQHNLYIGTYEGLYKVGNGKKAAEMFLKTDQHNAFFDAMLLEQNGTTLWAASNIASIIKIDLPLRQTQSFKLPGQLEITCIKEKSANELWLGTTQGLYVFNKKTGNTFPYNNSPNRLGNIIIYDILPAKNGTIWIASSNGLFFSDKEKGFINYQTVNRQFTEKEILALYENGVGNLWLGTYRHGVIFLEPNAGGIKKYNSSNGLSNNLVCGILESNGALWFATGNGLSRLDKQTQRFTVFHKEDGLAGNEFNLRSAYKKNDSTFYFGGLNGVVTFNPAQVGNYNSTAPKLFLFSAHYFSATKNKEINDYLKIEEKHIELPYNKNYFSARFSINELFYNPVHTYHYQIDGLTNGWIEAGTSGAINLFALPPGKHLLRVKGKDNKGQETANEILINLHVRQVFYKTPMFIVLVFVLAIGLTAYFFIRRNNQQKRKFEMEMEIMELKANALKAQMNPHFVFNVLNNMQSALILKGEREVNQYFVAFSKLLRLTLDMSRHNLVSLGHEMDYITNYLVLCNLQLNRTLQYTVNIEASITDAEHIFIPGMLIQPFVENAIIHGLSAKKEKKLAVNAHLDAGSLIISITDNGIGRAAAAQLAKQQTTSHQSLATHIVNERIRIMNKAQKDGPMVTLQIIDMEEEGRPTGTQVILSFKLEGK